MITKNKKGSTALTIVFVLLGIIMILGTFLAGTYNTLVGLDTDVENEWAKVQTSYERRLDLIPNLVATVKGSADFEKDTQTKVAEMRSGVRSASSVADMQKVDGQMATLMSGINIQVEAYPELKSTTNFLALQDEIAGTENRISWARNNYNDAVKTYKFTVRSFPTNILAKMYGFSESKWETYEAKDAADDAPVVSFD